MDGEAPAGPDAGGSNAPVETPAPAGSVPAAPSAPEPAAPSLSRWQRRERATLDALRTFIRDLHQAHFGARPPREAEVPLSLDLRLRAGEAWELVFDPPLADQVLEQVAEAEAEWGVYRDGAVYCYKCGSSTCPHATPAEPLAVFHGYEPMGQPEWMPLVQVLVEERDQRVDRLFMDGAPLLARVQRGRNLRTRQLGSFGRSSRSYSILGQVVAGYVGAGDRPRRAGGPAPERWAMTWQAVETRDAQGERRLRLNLLAALPPGMDREEWLASEEAGWIRRARDEARRALERMEEQARTARAQGSGEGVRAALGRMPAVLHRLAQSLERGHRQSARRTPHARRRRVMNRPVHKAFEDATAARPEAVFRDEKTAHLVACGEQGRAHVFTDAGRHVTSFVLAPGGADFRVRTHRWRPATAEEIDALKTALRDAALRAPTPADRGLRGRSYRQRRPGGGQHR